MAPTVMLQQMCVVQVCQWAGVLWSVPEHLPDGGGQVHQLLPEWLRGGTCLPPHGRRASEVSTLGRFFSL